MISHSFYPNDFRIGELVQVFAKSCRQKRGRWFSPRQLIKSDHDAGMSTVPGAEWYKRSVVFEDARAAHVTIDMTDVLQQSIDELDEYLDELLSSDISNIFAPDDLDHNHDDYGKSQSEVILQTESSDQVDVYAVTD